MTLEVGRIKAWLELNKKSSEWLADQMGVSFTLVTRMLGGTVPKKTETVMALARVMGCRVEDLVTTRQAKRTA